VQTIRDKYDELFTDTSYLLEVDSLDTRELIDTLETAHSKASGLIEKAILKSNMSMADKVRFGKLFR